MRAPPATERPSSELSLFGRALEGERRAIRRDGLHDEVEVAGADLSLVTGRRVAVLFHCELALLELDVRAHALALIATRQLEHRRVEYVEAGEGDELVPVATGAERLL